MRIICIVVTLLIATAVSAANTTFPFYRQFVAISVNGQRFKTKAPTLTVTQRRISNKASAGGSVDCNSWGADLKIDQDRFSVNEIFTTAILCSEVTALSSTFLEGLKAVKHWRLDGSTLILEGDHVTIILSARR